MSNAVVMERASGAVSFSDKSGREEGRARRAGAGARGMMGRGGGGNWQAKTHPALPHYPERKDSGEGRTEGDAALAGCLTGCCLLEDDNLPSLFVVVRTLSFISAVGSLSHPRLSSSPDRARMARKANPAINFHSRRGEASDRRERERGGEGRPLPVPSFLPYLLSDFVLSYPSDMASRRAAQKATRGPKRLLARRRHHRRAQLQVSRGLERGWVAHSMSTGCHVILL